MIYVLLEGIASPLIISIIIYKLKEVSFRGSFFYNRVTISTKYCHFEITR